jgi:alpha-L-arabinofuranosidase
VDQPLGIKLWQLGNGTSYGNECFSRDESIAHTMEFSKAMKQRDPAIRIIAWGDKSEKGGFWAPELLRRAGEHIDLVGVHMMGMQPRRPKTVLRGLEYQKQPEMAWAELLELSGVIERRISELRETIRPYKTGVAITEGHLGLRPQNAHPILTEWLSAVYHARCLNIYQRNGDMVRIATAADFQGTRWTVNAVMLPVPRGRSYLMPVASIMRLFKRHNGRQGVAVKSVPEGLDVCASRTGGKVYLHVANLNYRRPVAASFAVENMRVARGTVYTIAPESPRLCVSTDTPEVFRPVQSALGPAPAVRWTFPAASVSAVELEVEG